jgi:hypothetical protein
MGSVSTDTCYHSQLKSRLSCKKVYGIGARRDQELESRPSLYRIALDQRGDHVPGDHAPGEIFSTHPRVGSS